MKKIMITATVILMVLVMSVSAYAVEEELTISSMEGIPGDTVYLTVTLNETVVGDTLAVTYTFDSDMLEALIDTHAWSKTGLLQDFDHNHVGVWAKDTAADLKGPVCVLAFRIRDNQTFCETGVSCTVKVKNGSSDVGTYTAEATISLACAHKFGDWTCSDQFYHVRSCNECGKNQMQSHNWDSGTIVDNPDVPNKKVKIYTCTVCGGSYQADVPSEGEVQEPSNPGEMETMPSVPPTGPATNPGELEKQPDNQGGSANLGGNTNQGGNTNPGGNISQSGNTNQGGNTNPGGSISQSGNTNQGGNTNPGSNTNQGDNISQGGNTNQGGYVAIEDPAAAHNSAEDKHDHANDIETPIAVPIVTNPNATEHLHDHETEEPKPHNSSATAIVICAFFAAAAGGLFFFVKKKH